MAIFARVELHGGSWKDYDTLHKNLNAWGYWNTWVVGGVSYNLPPAVYYNAAATDLAAALVHLKTAATAAGFAPDSDHGAVTAHTSAIALVGVDGGVHAGLKKS